LNEVRCNPGSTTVRDSAGVIDSGLGKPSETPAEGRGSAGVLAMGVDAMGAGPTLLVAAGFVAAGCQMMSSAVAAPARQARVNPLNNNRLMPIPSSTPVLKRTPDLRARGKKGPGPVI
jgi:hypothetical protein